MRRLFVGILLYSFSILAWGQTEIEYHNKALKKAVQKEGVLDFSELKEIPVSDSLQQSYRLQGKFFEIDSDISQNKYIYTGRVNSCRAGGCSVSLDESFRGDSEFFDYFILFDSAKTVQLVKVFNYQATHGYEVTAKSWLKQFIGYDSAEALQVGKNIDAISGATISVYAITDDVALKTTLLNMLLQD